MAFGNNKFTGSVPSSYTRANWPILRQISIVDMPITGTIDANLAGAAIDVRNSCIDLPSSLLSLSNVATSRLASCPAPPAPPPPPPSPSPSPSPSNPPPANPPPANPQPSNPPANPQPSNPPANPQPSNPPANPPANTPAPNPAAQSPTPNNPDTPSSPGATPGSSTTTTTGSTTSSVTGTSSVNTTASTATTFTPATLFTLQPFTSAPVLDLRPGGTNGDNNANSDGAAGGVGGPGVGGTASATASAGNAGAAGGGSAGATGAPVLPIALGVVAAVVVAVGVVVAVLMVRRARRRGETVKKGVEEVGGVGGVGFAGVAAKPLLEVGAGAQLGAPVAMHAGLIAPTDAKGLAAATVVPVSGGFGAAAAASTASDPSLSSASSEAAVPRNPVPPPREHAALEGRFRGETEVVAGAKVAVATVLMKNEKEVGGVLFPAAETTGSVVGGSMVDAKAAEARVPPTRTASVAVSPTLRTPPSRTGSVVSGTGSGDAAWLVRVSRWTPAQVRDRLVGMGIGPGPARLLEGKGVDGYQLLLLNEERLVVLGVQDADARALVLFAAERLRRGNAGGVEEESGGVALPMYDE
ncbi:hypothetical protein HDU96_006826 [Phlyctochytrium bullatum]|nr:hypothetical protein HDU96_006826 [Phlyctochytrium bullatum]